MHTIHVYNRGAIVRRAHALKRELGITFGAAQRLAWAEAKGGAVVAAPSPSRALAMPRRFPALAYIIDAIRAQLAVRSTVATFRRAN